MNMLFESAKLGNLELKNRVVMAPLTRCRAIESRPNDLMAKYYGQRAGAGLIITEGTSPSPNGLGYARIPGLFNQEQVQGWKKVTDVVHSKGSRIFVQLMHTGRVSHSLNLPKGAKFLAPSAIAAPGQMWTDSEGQKDFSTPQEMTESEITEAIAEYARASKLGIQAGFDGVELHSANGYLMDQFLNTASNHRKDRWGGSIENRIRFTVEVARAVSAEIGADKVGIRISPYGVFNGMVPDAEMDNMYVALVSEMNKIGLLYVHVVDHQSMGAPEVSPILKAHIRSLFKGAYLLSGGYNSQRAEEDLKANRGDFVVFGRSFISNPDLVDKLKKGTNLTPPDQNTFYTPGEKGYTDYE